MKLTSSGHRRKQKFSSETWRRMADWTLGRLARLSASGRQKSSDSHTCGRIRSSGQRTSSSGNIGRYTQRTLVTTTELSAPPRSARFAREQSQRPLTTKDRCTMPRLLLSTACSARRARRELQTFGGSVHERYRAMLCASLVGRIIASTVSFRSSSPRTLSEWRRRIQRAGAERRLAAGHRLQCRPLRPSFRHAYAVAKWSQRHH